MGPFIYAFLVRKSFWLRGNLSKGLTHELKSPLGTIQGITEIFRNQVNNGEINLEKAKEYLNIIENNNQRLDTFIGDLLNVAKLEDQDVSIDKKYGDFSDLIQNECNTLLPRIKNKNLNLSLRIEPHLKIEFDSDKLRQAFSNLLTNSIKYSSKGTITVTVNKKDHHLFTTVSDEGVGILNSNLPKVFDRFYQGTKTAKGSAIGLTIAKAWVEAHGGKIWAESKGEGKGTTITFTLPNNPL